MTKLPVKRLRIKLRHAAYPIVIGTHLESELLGTLPRVPSKVAIITDSITRRMFAGKLAGHLSRAGHTVEVLSFRAGEKSKNQETVSSLQHQLLKKRFGRDSVIIALGGGVVGDVAGYVAATYLRGIPYIQMPTTLLAIVDSSVGGKVGVDTKYGKNMIGAFHQPRAVIADLSYCRSLSRDQVVNGLVEAVKKFITSDKRSLSLIPKLDLDHPLKSPRILQRIAYRSVKIKARVVMRDEEEKNERRILNFGHTIGHAIEFLSGYKLPHGFAVAGGMRVEAKIAELMGLLPRAEREAVDSIIGSLGIKGVDFKKYPIARVLKVIKGDKKASRGLPHYVLLRHLGSVYKKGGNYAHPVPEKIVRKAYESLLY